MIIKHIWNSTKVQIKQQGLTQNSLLNLINEHYKLKLLFLKCLYKLSKPGFIVGMSHFKSFFWIGERD